MLFQSQIYVLAFLPLTVALYYAAAGSAAGRQWVLIAASLFFYGWWDPRFVILVVSQITATWLLARAYERTGARAWLVAGVVLNLASLGTFKYLDFLLGSFEAASGIALPRAHLLLPIGITQLCHQSKIFPLAIIETQQRVDRSQELVGLNRLNQISVCAALQPVNPVSPGRVHRRDLQYHDVGAQRIALDRAAQLDAIYVGQPNIK